MSLSPGSIGVTAKGEANFGPVLNELMNAALVGGQPLIMALSSSSVNSEAVGKAVDNPEGLSLAKVMLQDSNVAEAFAECKAMVEGWELAKTEDRSEAAFKALAGAVRPNKHEDQGEIRRDLDGLAMTAATNKYMARASAKIMALHSALIKAESARVEAAVEVYARPTIVDQNAAPAMYSVMHVPYVYLFLAMAGYKVPFWASVKAKGLTPRAVSGSACASAERPFRFAAYFAATHMPGN